MVFQTFKRRLRTVRQSDFVSVPDQKPGKNGARVFVIVNQQETQASRSCYVSTRRISRSNLWFAQKTEKNSKCRASIFSFAVNSDPPAVEIEQSFGNGQAEAE